MKRLGMIEGYIYPNYETLHTESRENVVFNMIECMNEWESVYENHCLYGDLYVADEYMREIGKI